MQQFASTSAGVFGSVALLLCGALLPGGVQADGRNVHGLTLASDRPIANAVVWLEAPDATAVTPPGRVDRV